ncbi:MAG TPA: DNA-directed RNA polymerase subunit beta [Virgibacillus sp.]|nr:DNA-directed RNA polymerase subunit beta [Virgibacillus sp.]
MTETQESHKKNNEGQTRTERQSNKEKPRKLFGVRKFPILLRILVILILLVLALVLGLIVGYGVLGDGEPLDALDIETWQHIIDIVKKDEG